MDKRKQVSYKTSRGYVTFLARDEKTIKLKIKKKVKK